MNQIFTIRPYLWEGVWVFDDAAVGLVREALVYGMPELIRMATAEAGIENPERGFVALFSRDPFPGATIELSWVREEMNGNIYVWRGQEGWLCPALLRYFDPPPRKLFIEVRPGDDHSDFENWFASRMQQVGPQVAALLGNPPLEFQARVHDWLRSFAHEAWQSGRHSRS